MTATATPLRTAEMLASGVGQVAEGVKARGCSWSGSSAVISDPVAVLPGLPGLLCRYGYRLNCSQLTGIQAERYARTSTAPA